MILTEVGTVSKDCFYNRKWSRNRLQTRRQYKERLTRYNSDSDKISDEKKQNRASLIILVV